MCITESLNKYFVLYAAILKNEHVPRNESVSE
jgi:hypothetical protein